MSEYVSALQNRIEALEAAKSELDRAKSDSFIDHAQQTELDEAMRNAGNVLSETEAELSVLDKDWDMVESHVEEIESLLEAAAQRLDEEGLAEFDYHNRELDPILDDEPTELHDARTYIDRALDDWHRTLMAVREVLEDTGSTGGRF